MVPLTKYQTDIISLIQQHSPGLFSGVHVTGLEDLLASQPGVCASDAVEVRRRRSAVSAPESDEERKHHIILTVTCTHYHPPSMQLPLHLSQPRLAVLKSPSLADPVLLCSVLGRCGAS